MRKHKVTIPQLLFVIGTRVALGAGVAMLISNRLKEKTRKKLGRSLIALGAITTIPAARMVARH